jgi:hypothetical protein
MSQEENQSVSHKQKVLKETQTEEKLKVSFYLIN